MTGAWNGGRSLEQVKPISEWFVEHLSLFDRQVRLDESMAFKLSGGKDSRLMLTTFIRAEILDRQDSVLTYGDDEDPEVRAASPIARHYGLRHEIVAGDSSPAKLFDRLPLHIFQTEGEVNAHTLKGDYLDTRENAFSGHG